MQWDRLGKALVAIGETSSNGRNKPKAGSSPLNIGTMAPGASENDATSKPTIDDAT